MHRILAASLIKKYGKNSNAAYLFFPMYLKNPHLKNVSPFLYKEEAL